MSVIKGSSLRKAERPINELLLDRWSPRAMSGEPVSAAELLTMFEAARWAPSSMNFQPWRMLYAHRDTTSWSLFFDLVGEGNRPWAQRAGALVLFISRTHIDDGRASITHSFDTGAAWQNFALQGYHSGLAVHGIQGFDYQKARTVLLIPDEYRVEAMAVVGRPADRATLPEPYQAREQPNSRRPVAQTVCEGVFNLG
jgi:nitroreductase